MYTFTIAIDSNLARDLYEGGIIGELEYDEPAPKVYEIIQDYIEEVFERDPDIDGNFLLQSLVGIAMNKNMEFIVNLKL